MQIGNLFVTLFAALILGSIALALLGWLIAVNMPGFVFLLAAPHVAKKGFNTRVVSSYAYIFRSPAAWKIALIWLLLAPIQWLPAWIAWARGDGWTFGGALLACGLVIGSVFSIYGAWRLWEMNKDIFDLIPPDQRSGFWDFLAKQDATPHPGGGRLNLIGKTPEAVIAAIKQDVIGQDAIVEDVVRMIFRRAAVIRPNKPVAVAMFVGATGAGKTELAKSLANHIAQGRLIRVDCNEVTESQGISRFIGSPPGYIGSEQGGWLCREIGNKGTGVLLFDEVEKAHPDVFKLIMGLMDEARITEAATNRTYSATGFVIVLTSNAEHEQIADIVRNIADPADRANKIKDALRSVFKPEQLARIDEIYAFGDLSSEAIARVIGKFLFAFAKQVGVELVEVDAALLVQMIAQREKLKKYGVREVIRLIEKTVMDGMLDARAQGAKRVRIVVQGPAVQVLPAN
jgi:energy-coupling factor transporter ATP-binding protein EcfA2